LGSNYNRRLLNRVKKTIIRYDMLAEGDRVALGVSGGKDSSALLYFFHLVRAHAPFPFSLQAIFVDLGWEMDLLPLKEFCAALEIPLHLEKTHIAEIVFQKRKEKNPCPLCAKMRRGALHKAAGELGCNRVALGHHLDDAVETFFLNMFFAGKLDTFKPHTYLSRRDLYLLRPLISLTGEEISLLAGLENLPAIVNPCPVAGRTKRHEVGKLVKYMVTRYPFFYERFVTSMEKSGLWSTDPFSWSEKLE
jgi:tRNA 2-thiocytidine biosynthesis protein TtcA